MHLDVELLVAHMTGELGDAERARVASHLAACSRCRRTAAELVRTDDAADLGSLIGQELGGYLVQELIGAGAFSEVYRAVEPKARRGVALKVLKPQAGATAEVTRRLLDEARAAIAIRHPGLAEVYGVGLTPDGRAYLVMELLEGQTLEQSMVRRGRLPEAEVVGLLRAMLEALGAVHAAGVVHRDLKPSNVFITTGSVKLLDLGLAKLGVTPGRRAEQTAGLAVGTPAYCAPEQALGQPVGASSDLYSLGVIAYELLTGELPYRTLVERASPPRPLPHWVSRDLEGLVRRLLEAEPARRPADVGQVLRALDYRVPAERPTELEGVPALPTGHDAPTDVVGRPALGPEVRGPRRRGVRELVWVGLVVAVAVGVALWLRL